MYAFQHKLSALLLYAGLDKNFWVKRKKKFRAKLAYLASDSEFLACGS
jgi:hypothetical protein